METVIEVLGLTKKYNNGRGVDNISFDIKKGDIFGLLGPNGCGKTTTMKMLSALCRADSGSVKIFGFDPEDEHEKAMSSVGCLIEAPALYDYMTAYKNLKIMAAFYKGVNDDAIHNVLELCGIIAYKNEKVGNFSLGMRQRLGIALALLSSPQLVILDEPANGLDIEGMVDVRTIISDLAAKGVTFLISSHLAREIELVCNKVAIMHEGKFIDVVSMETALQQHPSLEDYYLTQVTKQRRVDISGGLSNYI